jgi:hypothetical protein
VDACSWPFHGAQAPNGQQQGLTTWHGIRANFGVEDRHRRARKRFTRLLQTRIVTCIQKGLQKCIQKCGWTVTGAAERHNTIVDFLLFTLGPLAKFKDLGAALCATTTQHGPCTDGRGTDSSVTLDFLVTARSTLKVNLSLKLTQQTYLCRLQCLNRPHIRRLHPRYAEMQLCRGVKPLR